MSFLIKRTKTMPKALKGVTFDTYEAARSTTRKYIRATYDVSGSSNPAISDYGFRVEAVQQTA